jgi:signal transduction histidine kinase
LKSGNILVRVKNTLSHTVLSRLLISYIAIMLTMLAAQSLLMGTIYQDEYRKNRIQTLQKEATDLFPYYVAWVREEISDNSFSKIVQSVEQRQSVKIMISDYFHLYELTGSGSSKSDSAETQDLAQLQLKSGQEYDKFFDSILKSGKPKTTQGLFYGQFSSEVLTVGVPITVSQGIPVGVIFVHTQMSALNEAVGKMYRQIATSAAFAMALGIILITLMSTRISRPLVQMNQIAGYIAKGDFGKRADVKSRDEIGQLAQSFNTMAEELKKQEDLRSGFVANVSHELRSPLTSIHGFAQGMLDGTIPPDDHQKYLGVIVGETRRLNKLIRELLDLSQIESGKFPLNIQSFDVNELISRVLITFEEKIEEKKLEIEVDFRQDKATVLADPDRIEQVVINLLDNAVKFTDEGGRIKLWTHGASDKILIGIGDSGPGIPEEDQPYVWERFYKVDKSHTGRKGTGLGLSIVKKIIDQHGERITLQSQPGSGAVFVFSLKKPD